MNLLDRGLHSLGDFLRFLLLQLPLPAVRILFVAVPATLLMWVWLLPRSAVTPPDRPARWYENLKLGASVALVLQIVIYSLL